MSSFKMFGSGEWYGPLGVSYEFDEVDQLGFMIPGMGTTWLSHKDIIELHEHLSDLLRKASSPYVGE